MPSATRSWTPRAAARSTGWRVVLGLVVVAAILAGCSDGDDAEGARPPQLAELLGVLPTDARGAFAVDLDALRSGGSSDQIDAVVAGEVPGAGLLGPLAEVGRLTEGVDLDRVTTALLVHTADPAAGQVVVADVEGASIDDLAVGPAPAAVDGDGSSDVDRYEHAVGHQLALLPDGVLVVGAPAAVEAVVDVADGAASVDDGPFGPYLDALDGRTPIAFAYALPALDDDAIEPDRSLRGAEAVSGAMDVSDGAATGTLAFHMADAERFVEDYEALNRNATGGDDPTEEPLTVGDPLVDGVAPVVVPLPTTPLDPSPEESLALRNLTKKLFVGMEAHDYAEGVAEGNPALVDLIVKSEEDGDEPPSPGSVFIRWRFRDQAAIEAFERDELPEGFRLAPTRFLESDDPDGELFLALNLYNSGGGSIVEGARAEWDVFVEPPAGADPDAGVRPRFMVIDALAESVSADPVNLVTPAEPLSHQLVDGRVVSDVRRLAGEGDVPVFSSSFPVPDPAEAPVARFTREMAIGNDYIYWGHGVHDRVLYNATTFNHDAYHVDPATVTVDDASRWAQYLEPEIHDVVYYVNTLEYIASPLANLDSDLLDITPGWRAELQAFKDNGHQTGLMRAAVDQLFRGESDALVARRLANEIPSTTYHWEITDPEGLEAALDLPDGYRLAPTTLLEGGAEADYLTLSVREEEGAIEGPRAEWQVHVDDGSGRPPRTMVIETMTGAVTADPVAILDLPSAVGHTVDGGVVRTSLSSPTVAFDASYETAGATDEVLALDGIEAGDEVCHVDGTCDAWFYDAETLDVPAHRPAEVTVGTRSTPWDEFLGDAPALVLYRDNPQELAVKRWENLAVVVPELPFSGLEDRTHEIGGRGSLTGRTTDVVDSDYSYAGDAVVDGDQLAFAIDQQILNALGEAHIYTTGEFDLTTGEGTQTVVDCTGPDLMCSDIERGSTALYAVGDLDADDPDAITWTVDVAVELGGTFGTADSTSTFTATRAG